MAANLTTTQVAQHLGNYDQTRPISLDQQLARMKALVLAARRRDDAEALAILKGQWETLKAQIAAE